MMIMPFSPASPKAFATRTWNGLGDIDNDGDDDFITQERKVIRVD